MKISIAMATFNGEKYIQQQLDSLREQIVIPDELIVCDDASTDSTVEIINAFSQKSPFELKIYLNDRNIGYKKNFEKAALLATGDVIFYCDQDDLWSPDKIKEVLEHFVSNEKCLCVTHDISVSFLDNRSSIPSYFSHLQSLGRPIDFFVKGCATAFRAEAKSLLFPIPIDEGWSHDAWMNYGTSLLGRRAIIEKVLQTHRIHSDNTVGYITTNVGVMNSILSVKIIRRILKLKNEFRVIQYMSGRQLSAVERLINRLSLENKISDQIARTVSAEIHKQKIFVGLRRRVSRLLLLPDE